MSEAVEMVIVSDDSQLGSLGQLKWLPVIDWRAG